jgi:undecaprenyl-diphosphatase
MIVILAKYLFLVSFAIVGIVFFTLSKKDKKKMFFLSLFSGIISVILLKISAMLVNDPRPFVVNHVIPLIPHVADNGFPSDHTLLTMWLALVVYFYNKKLGIVLIIVSITVGISRVLALVHHPIDIIGSMIIAIISVFISSLIVKKQLSNKKLNF